MSHYQKYLSQWYPQPDGPQNDPLRIFIRRNRKKILIFLGIGAIVVITIIAMVGIFLFTKVIPVGTEAVSQSVNSGEAQGVVGGFINWLMQLVNNINLSQLLNLFLQFN